MAVPSVLASFFSLVSSVSDFCPDTRTGGGGGHFVFFLGSLVQSRCGEGGMLQTNNTGVCLQCLSPTGPAPAHGAPCSGSRLLRREPSEAGPGVHTPPRSKPLRLRHSGSPQRHRLGWACDLCPPFPGLSSSGVWRAQSLRLIAFPISATQFSGCTSGAPS